MILLRISVIKQPLCKYPLKRFSTTTMVKKHSNQGSKTPGLSPNERFFRDALTRSFSSNVSYPDTETEKNLSYEDFIETHDQELDDLELESRLKIIPAKAEGLSEYDWESCKPTDVYSFQSIEHKLQHELQKCFGNIAPNHSTISAKIIDEQKILEEGLQKDGKTKENKTEKKKKGATGHTFLSTKESIEIVNKREYNLISIDNEFYERSNKFVTEIGISIYNPKYQQFSLFPHILNIHFILKEHINKRNGKFVPDSKMNNITGQSIIISEKDVPRALKIIFDYLGAKTCLVGHNFKSDISSFKHVRFDVPLTYGVIDTSELWYSLMGSKNVKSSLGFILDSLSIPCAFLHNGVNDAYFTLIACLMLTSPELRNNMIFKKIKNDVDKISDSESEAESVTTEQEMPDFSMYTPEEQEIKKKRWIRKMEKKASSAKKKADKKVKKKVFEDIKIRCSLDEETILTKHKTNFGRKNENPPSNKFYKPKSYNETDLNDLLHEFTV